MEAALAIQEFIEYVVIQLIDHPEDAAVIHEADEDGGNHHEYWLRLNHEDVGRVIGRNGSTIAAIRSLASAAGQKNDLRVAVEIEEDEEEAERHRNQRSDRGDRGRDRRE